MWADFLSHFAELCAQDNENEIKQYETTGGVGDGGSGGTGRNAN